YSGKRRRIATAWVRPSAATSGLPARIASIRGSSTVRYECSASCAGPSIVQPANKAFRWPCRRSARTAVAIPSVSARWTSSSIAANVRRVCSSARQRAPWSSGTAASGSGAFGSGEHAEPSKAAANRSESVRTRLQRPPPRAAFRAVASAAVLADHDEQHAVARFARDVRPREVAGQTHGTLEPAVGDLQRPGPHAGGAAVATHAGDHEAAAL